MGQLIHVLGLGPTLQEYLSKQPDGITVGVNDAAKYNTDYVVVIDKPHLFPEGRKKVIEQYKGKLVSCCPEWHPHDLIKLAAYKEGRKRQPGKYWSCFTSAFVAIDYAFTKLKAKDVVLWGVDIKGHHQLGQYFDLIEGRLLDYAKHKRLYKGSKDCPLNLPIWK